MPNRYLRCYLSCATSDNAQVREHFEKHREALEDPGCAMTDWKNPDMQPSKSFKTRTTMTSLGDNNIINAVMKIGADENLQDAQANVAAFRQLANGQKFSILCDYRQIRKQSRDMCDSRRKSSIKNGRHFFGLPNALIYRREDGRGLAP